MVKLPHMSGKIHDVIPSGAEVVGTASYVRHDPMEKSFDPGSFDQENFLSGKSFDPGII